MRQLGRPLADTWGCSHQGHVKALVERLGRFSIAVQQIVESENTPGLRRVYREELVEQLAEMAASAVVMLTEELAVLRDGAPALEEKLG